MKAETQEMKKGVEWGGGGGDIDGIDERFKHVDTCSKFKRARETVAEREGERGGEDQRAKETKTSNQGLRSTWTLPHHTLSSCVHYLLTLHRNMHVHENFFMLHTVHLQTIHTLTN